ncbi:MAG TPA: hypothetical protein VLD67_16130 [Vicinamibacterales bacterium]|nr:hypothetical protein [Vicinamibacterales bacterium]
MNDFASYCREIETYLCRKNDGQLIRIVGPAFERVCSWAEHGVPLRIAFRGIDRYCERYHSKRPRRRPVRIEFCEADILESFDEWRRAVGVPGSGSGDQSKPRRPALASHIERAVARLNGCAADGGRSPAFHARIEATVRELHGVAPEAAHARGEGRAKLVELLRQLDEELMRSAAGELDPATEERLSREAEVEVAPFASRMAPEAKAAATGAAFQRLVRESLRLPVLKYE